MEVLEVPPEGIASSDHLEEEEDSQQEEDSQEVSEEIKNNDEQIVQMIPSLLLREHEQYDEHSAGNVDVISSSVEEGALPQSFRKVSYESKEMKRLVALHDPQEKLPVGLNDVNYYQNLVFPDWILSNPLWKNAPKHNENFNEISEILKVPVSKRTQEQISTLIHWLMSVWAVANTMGFKRCGAMFKEFKYQTFEENEKVIVEGERGLTFYIIISGNAVVHKEGIGIVGQLGKAKSFGEIALTQGKDLRTATIIAATKLEVLSLHKLDYDYFVRDIQEMEKRENFQILANCKLFQSWPKGKIEKICNTCLRKTFEAGQYIFRQGDAPEDLCVVVEGTVSIVKELVILSKNRWPTAKHEWEERVLKHTKPIQLKTLQRGDFFGEVAILKNIPRSTSAVATTRSVLISLDKLEFLHLVNMGGGASSMLEEADGELSKAIKKYVVDEDLIAAIGEIKGGPGSAAILGDMTLNKAELEYQTRIMEGFSSRPMSPSTSRPRSPSRPRSRGRTSPPSNRSRANSDHNKGNGKTMRERLEKLSKQDSIAESILNMADEKKKVDERIRAKTEAYRSINDNSRISSPHKRKSKKNQPQSNSISFVDDSTSSPDKYRNNLPIPLSTALPTAHETSFTRSRLATARKSSISFARQPVNMIRPRKRLQSIQGVDNDKNFHFDANQVVLRRNSAINLGMVYDHLYQKLQQDVIDKLTDSKDALGNRRKSTAKPNPALDTLMNSYNEKRLFIMHKNAIFEGDEHHDGSEDESDADEDHDEYNDDDIANHVVGHRPFSAPGDFGAVSKHNQQHDECEGTQSMSPLLRRLSIRDSQRQRLATPAPHHMALNTTSPTRILHNNFNQPAHTSLTGASNSNPSSPKNRHP